MQELTLPEELDARINELLGHLVQAGPASLAAAKDLIGAVASRPIEAKLIADTATRIARARASDEGKEGVRSFLEKRKPVWDPEAKASTAGKTKRGSRVPS